MLPDGTGSKSMQPLLECMLIKEKIPVKLSSGNAEALTYPD